MLTYIMPKILRKIRIRAAESHIHTDEHKPYGMTANLPHGWMMQCLPVTFQLIPSSRRRHNCFIIVDVTRQHGMQLSCGPGKTAVVLEFHGPKAARIRQQCAEDSQGHLAPLRSL